MIQNDVLAKFKEIFGDEGDIRVYFAPGKTVYLYHQIIKP